MLSLVDAIFLHLTKMSRIELTRPFRTRELNGRKKPMSDSGAQRPTPKFTTLLLLSRNITLVYTGNAIRRKLSLSRNPNKSPKKLDFRGPRFFVPFSFWSIVRFDLFFFWNRDFWYFARYPSGEGSVLIPLLTCMRARMCDSMAGRANFANDSGGKSKSFFLTTDNAADTLTAATCGKDFWTRRRTVVRYNNNNNNK